MQSRSFLRPIAYLCAAILLVYSTGISGPFVLDDHVNLNPIWSLLSGRTSTIDAVFGNGSGPVGRPLAYFTFLLNARLGGTAPLGFKVVNLALHMGAASLVLLLLARVSAHDTRSEGRVQVPQLAVLLAVAVWTLHPLQVSTVLYVIQRMTLLAALAQLGVVLIYLQARIELAHNPARGRRLLFAAIPALVLAGALSKETALLAPALCAAIEFTMYARASRPAAVGGFFALFLLLPLAIGVLFLAMDPDWLKARYEGREFDLSSRLLTQPRILLDYAVAWFWPSPENLGLYRDGYPHSSGLLDPPGTLGAIALWAGAVVFAWLVRLRRPLLALGILWFLASHALESTFLPLEPYYEHRNYLASLGLILVAFDLCRLASHRIPPRVAKTSAAAILLGLMSLTAWRAWQWGDIDRLMATEGPPNEEISRRLQVDRAIRGLETGNTEASTRALALLSTSDQAGDRAAAAIWQVLLACERDEPITAAMDRALAENPPPIVTHSHLSWLDLLARVVSPGSCRGLTPGRLAQIAAEWQQPAAKPITAANRKRLEHTLARLRTPAETPK